MSTIIVRAAAFHTLTPECAIVTPSRRVRTSPVTIRRDYSTTPCTCAQQGPGSTPAGRGRAYAERDILLGTAFVCAWCGAGWLQVA